METSARGILVRESGDKRWRPLHSWETRNNLGGEILVEFKFISVNAYSITQF